MRGSLLTLPLITQIILFDLAQCTDSCEGLSHTTRMGLPNLIGKQDNLSYPTRPLTGHPEVENLLQRTLFLGNSMSCQDGS